MKPEELFHKGSVEDRMDFDAQRAAKGLTFDLGPIRGKDRKAAHPKASHATMRARANRRRMAKASRNKQHQRG